MDITITILTDCAGFETITKPTVNNIQYTFKDPIKTEILPSFTSSSPIGCPVNYFIKCFDPVGTSWHFGCQPGVWGNMVTFDNTTQSLSVFYDVDNRFTPTNGVTNI